jgi:hypothetical protein
MIQHGTPRYDTLRNVIAFAREVRIRFHDAHEIFASVVAAEAKNGDSFVVRPWGVSSTRKFLYEEVARATPVRNMAWEKQREIYAAQALSLEPAILPEA